METLSRVSSRRPLLASQDDTESLTSFPEIAPGSPTTTIAPTMAEHLNGLLDRSEPTMFDERPAVNADDPRALSAADSAVLQGVLDHHGAINLVKRLSESLAERDAHITALQRLCEEYKVPLDRVTDTACRVRQAERRRLSLSAASEDLAPSRGTQSESSVCHGIKHFLRKCNVDVVFADCRHDTNNDDCWRYCERHHQVVWWRSSEAWLWSTITVRNTIILLTTSSPNTHVTAHHRPLDPLLCMYILLV
jgi:hypothetical protein